MEKQHKRYGLFAKYFFVISVVILICFTVLGSSLLLFVSNYRRTEKTNLLVENATSIAKTTQRLMSSGQLGNDSTSNAVLMSNTLSLVSNAIDADVFICDTSGKVIICSDMITNDWHIVRADECPVHRNYRIPQDIMVAVAEKGEYVKVSRLGDIYENTHFVAGAPVNVSGEIKAVVFATEPVTDSVYSFVRDVFKMFGFSALLSLLLAFVAVYILTYNMVKPLREMSEATKNYAKGDFAYRVKVQGDDELSDLAEAFNTMARDLAVLESSRRSFVANVSHELKTPMTTIGGFIDGMLDGTIPPEKHNHYLKIVSDEVKRLSRLVVMMLNMSKIEAGEFKMKPSKFDLSQQLFQILLQFEQPIENKAIEIEGLDTMQSVTVEADPDMIHQVVYNLLDNAVKFTNTGGKITFSVISDGEKVIVRIRNTGDGISSEEMSKIFERFYKVDKSRSIDVKGAGLGLYIVRNFIELHGGQITVQSKEGEYAEFVFWLPTRFSGKM